MGDARKRTSINLLKEAEVALKLYALRMPLAQGRERGVSLAIERLLYKNQDFRSLLPEARQLIKDGKAAGLRVYRPSEEQREVIETIKRGTTSEPGGEPTTTDQ